MFIFLLTSYHHHCLYALNQNIATSKAQLFYLKGKNLGQPKYTTLRASVRAGLAVCLPKL